MARIWFFSTETSSSYLNKFSRKTFKDFGKLEMPSKPFFSASFRE